MDDKEQVQAYRELMGDDATARQLTDKVYRRNCCWTLMVEQHHPQCRNHPKVKVTKQYRKLFPEGETQQKGDS